MEPSAKPSLPLPFQTERRAAYAGPERRRSDTPDGISTQPPARILVVEDVITTGGSTRECIEALESRGAKIVGAASIIDRSGGAADVGVPRIALVSMEVPSYKPEDCPMCKNGDVAYKPGSRK